MARRGRARMTWAGFALFGWIYLGTTFGPWADGNGVKAPPYVTRWVLDYTAAWLRDPDRRDTGVEGEVLFSPYPTWGVVAGMGGGMSALVPPRDFRAFHRIGHCLAAIMFGMVGAVLGRLIAPGVRRWRGRAVAVIIAARLPYPDLPREIRDYPESLILHAG